MAWGEQEEHVFPVHEFYAPSQLVVEVVERRRWSSGTTVVGVRREKRSGERERKTETDK